MSGCSNTYYAIDTQTVAAALEKVGLAQAQMVRVEGEKAHLQSVNASLNEQIVNGNKLVESMNETIAKLTAEKTALTTHAVAREGKLFALEDENAALKLELQQALLAQPLVVVPVVVVQQATEPELDDGLIACVSIHKTIHAVTSLHAERANVLTELHSILFDAVSDEADLKIEQKHLLVQCERGRLAIEKDEQDRLALLKQEQDRLALLKEEEDRQLAAKQEQDRLALLKEEEDRQLAAKQEQDRLALVKEEDLKQEQDRLALLKKQEEQAREAEQKTASEDKYETERAAKAQKKLAKQLRAQEEKLAAKKKEDEKAEQLRKIEEERLATRKAQEETRRAQREQAKKEREEDSRLAKSVIEQIKQDREKTRKQEKQVKAAAKGLVTDGGAYALAAARSIWSDLEEDLGIFASGGSKCPPVDPSKGDTEKFLEVTNKVFRLTSDPAHKFLTGGKFDPHNLVQLMAEERVGSVFTLIESSKKGMYKLVSHIAFMGTAVLHESPLATLETIVKWLEQEEFTKVCDNLFGPHHMKDEGITTAVTDMFATVVKHPAFNVLRLTTIELTDGFGMPMHTLTYPDGRIEPYSTIQLIVWFFIGKIIDLASTTGPARRA